MKRLEFNSQGKLVGVDNNLLDFKTKTQNKNPYQKFPPRNSYQNTQYETNPNLKTSESLEFLKQSKKIENIFDKDYWSLYQNDKPLAPLKFSNGKTQEDIVKEIVDLIEGGKKIIFLHGVCGTGKSAIALNIARSLGKTSIVVPIKSLQKQYEKDYMGDKYVLKHNKEKLRIAMITGRDNHDSIIEPGKSCANPFLPDTIKITEKNREKIKEYYQENPFISGNVMPSLKAMKRISIAPANPYWSPILPSAIDLKQLKDATKKTYTAMEGKDFTFYHRKQGCSYYDQYLAYLSADVIIFNSAKYLTEIASGKKPETKVEIIDEADEFLDSLSNSAHINLTRLAMALRTIATETEGAETSRKRAIELIELEEKNKIALGIDEKEIFELKKTNLLEMLKILLSNAELQTEISIDDMNYANKALEAAREFEGSFGDTYLTYRKEEDNIYATLVTTNLSKKFKEIVDKNKAVVLMSGTLHSDATLRDIFGIKEFATVEAETLNQGAIEIFRTGKEFDCRYSNFKAKKFTRKQYLEVLQEVVNKSEKPSLVHVNAFADLPTYEESQEFGVSDLVSKEELRERQFEDKTSKTVIEFKARKFPTLFTTKCSRGIDFPGDTCRSVIFTKYPNPNVQDTFWKVLKKTHESFYWEFYKDKARREFLQRIYRAVRSKDDHVFVLSPDSRVLQAVRDLQVNGS